MKRILFEDALIYSALRALRAVAEALPFTWRLRAARWAGFAYSFVGKRRHIAERNLRACFAAEKSPREIRSLVRRNFAHLAANAAELLAARRIDARFVAAHVTIENERVLTDALARGRGVILLTGHFGNWELVNLVGALRGHPTTVFVRPQKHPRSDAFLNSLRASKGSEIVYKGISARGMVRALAAGRVVGVLADQDAGRHGVFAPFFGRPSSWPRGAVHFARRTGAAVIPIFHIRGKGLSQRIVCGADFGDLSRYATDEEAEREVMGRFAAILEERIRENPEQWLWPHRRWKSSPLRRGVVLSDGKTGHRKQSEAFAQALADARERRGVEKPMTRIRVIEIKYRGAPARAALYLWGWLADGRFPAGWRLLRAALEPASFEALAGAYADYVISCGAALEPVNLIFAAQNGARSCVIHRPHFGLGRYAAVVAPRHDRLPPRPNVFETAGALCLPAGEAGAASGPARPPAANGGAGTPRRVGLLVGGPARHTRWSDAAISRAAGRLKEAYARCPFELLVTSSRRTPQETERNLKRFFGDWPPCKQLVIANEKNPPGAYDGILAESDMLVVTADSISMVSEAAATGKPVFVLTGENGARGKMGEFLKNLEEAGTVEVVAAETLADALGRPEFRAGACLPRHSGQAAGRSGRPDSSVIERAAQQVVQ